jgi:PAS domain S-box-containing protein
MQSLGIKPSPLTSHRDDEVSTVPADPLQPEIQDAMSLVGDGVISTDAAGTILQFNHAAEDIFGYKSVEVVGCPIDVLIPPRFHDNHRAALDGFASTKLTNPRAMGTERNVLGLRKDGEEFSLEATLAKHIVRGRPVLTVVVRDVTERQRAERQRLLLMEETAHRLRNTMAIVNAIVSLSARDSDSVASFKASLLARLAVLSRTNEALMRGAWTEADLEELVRNELQMFQRGTNRIAMTGPKLHVTARIATAFGLIIHELATNAAKYGALSSPDGRVTVAWRFANSDLSRVAFEWIEQGGPRVVPPTRKGFGSELIAINIESLGSTPHVEYPPQGLICRFEFPLA